MASRLRPQSRLQNHVAPRRPASREARFWKSIEIPSPLPRHIAVCMDGNRRWAVQNGVSLQTAYRRAEAAAESVVASCQYLGIEALTLFAFSCENWERDPVQVLDLMSLLEWKIRQIWPQWKAQNLRVRFMGDFARLSHRMIHLIRHVEHETQCNDGLLLTIALSYGGRQDLLGGVREIAQRVQNGALQMSDITEASLEDCLQSHAAYGSIGDPDLFVRTSGEQRLSNFMLWDMAYTELSFQSILWPDFAPHHLRDVLQDYSRRERRYGR